MEVGHIRQEYKTFDRMLRLLNNQGLMSSGYGIKIHRRKLIKIKKKLIPLIHKELNFIINERYIFSPTLESFAGDEIYILTKTTVLYKSGLQYKLIDVLLEDLILIFKHLEE